MSSQSVGFGRRYDRKHFGVFFSVHSVYKLAIKRAEFQQELDFDDELSNYYV